MLCPKALAGKCGGTDGYEKWLEMLVSIKHNVVVWTPRKWQLGGCVVFRELFWAVRAAGSSRRRVLICCMCLCSGPIQRHCASVSVIVPHSQRRRQFCPCEARRRMWSGSRVNSSVDTASNYAVSSHCSRHTQRNIRTYALYLQRSRYQLRGVFTQQFFLRCSCNVPLCRRHF